ncbi:hypothetical protein SCA6_020558 [Theobroma cacao]
MVSYFCDCKTLGVVVMLLLIQSSMAESDEHPLLYESSSREEMMQMAGYGEEKLSTVLVTGTVLCEACLHAEPQLRAWPISGFVSFVHHHYSLRSALLFFHVYETKLSNSADTNLYIYNVDYLFSLSTIDLLCGS